MEDKQTSWTGYFRVITPFLLLVLTAFASIINQRLQTIEQNLSAIDAKVFHHMTNDEIHVNRSSVVNKDEFVIYQTMRDKQMTDIKCDLADIKTMMENHVTRK